MSKIQVIFCVILVVVVMMVFIQPIEKVFSPELPRSNQLATAPMTVPQNVPQSTSADLRKIKGTELWVAEEIGNPTQNYVVRIRTRDHKIIANLGKIE